jgi:large subunit ribosomal protein L15
VKTAGRGQKGQKARTGARIPAYFEGGQNRFSQRMPYKAGFKNRFKKQFAIVDLDQLRRTFEAGAEVNAEILAAKGVIDRLGRKEMLKILGDGDLDRALRVRAHKFSASARSKIEAAGGSVDVIEPPPPRDPKTKRAPKGSEPADARPAAGARS